MSTLHAYAEKLTQFMKPPIDMSVKIPVFANNNMDEFTDALQKYDKCMKKNKGDVLKCYLERKKLIDIAMGIKPYHLERWSGEIDP